MTNSTRVETMVPLASVKPVFFGGGSMPAQWFDPPSYRFFSVMLMPKLSIIMNDVSRFGFVVIAFI